MASAFIIIESLVAIYRYISIPHACWINPQIGLLNTTVKHHYKNIPHKNVNLQTSVCSVLYLLLYYYLLYRFNNRIIDILIEGNNGCSIIIAFNCIQTYRNDCVYWYIKFDLHIIQEYKTYFTRNKI